MAGTETKRIIELTEASTVQSGDFIAVDSNARGTKKVSTDTLATSAALTAETNARAGADEQMSERMDGIEEQTALIQNPTKTLSGALVSFTDGADMPMVACRAEIVPKQSGTGTPSPSNVRPISGWESVETSVCGKNLLPSKFYSGISYNRAVGTVYTLTDITDTFTETDGVFSKSVSAWGGASMVSEALPNGSYRINVALTSSGLRLTGYILDADYKVIRQFDLIASGTSYSENRTITLSDSETYIALYVASNVSGSISFGQPQIEYGTSATEYTPYITPTTQTTSLGRTVYGGTLDVVTGVLTVDRAMVDLGTLTWTASTNDWFFANTPSVSVDTLTSGDTNALCENYDRFDVRSVSSITDQPDKTFVVNSSRFSSAKKVVVKDSDYSDGADFKTAMSGVQLVYELATPQTYQLTPTEIQTLLGENNVWADSGDVAITYRRDISIVLENLENALNGSNSLNTMMMSAPTENTAEEPTEDEAEDDMR